MRTWIPAFRTVILIAILPHLVFLALSAQAGGLKIEFDYSLDTDNFFDDSTAAGLERRATLEAAASLYQFADELTAIVPQPGSSWSASVFHPSAFGSVVITDRVIPQDTVVIYVGGRPIPVAGVLGFANPATNITALGSAEFMDAVHTRGQVGAAEPVPSDFAPALGSITFFHSDAFQWHYGTTTVGLTPAKSDFLTTAVHEIGHLLGLGEAPSWFQQIESVGDAEFFYGNAATAAYGGPVPVDSIGAHFASGIQSSVGGIPQGLLMDPSTARGVRELPTELDLAAFRDIGWVVVPEPGGLTLALGACLSILGLAQRKSRLLRPRAIRRS